MNKISNVEQVTSSKGTQYKRCTIIAPDKTYTGVAVFATFPEYAQVVDGAEVGGVIKTKDWNGKPSYSLESDAPKTGGMGGGIAKAQETKHAHIREAQDNKAESILMSSTFRAATELTIAMYGGKEIDSNTLKTTWKKWRAWLLDEYSNDQRVVPKVVGTDVEYPTEDINPADIPF